MRLVAIFMSDLPAVVTILLRLSCVEMLLVYLRIVVCNLQVLKLLERLEVQMIGDVKRKIQKEVSLALAERARDENSTLPTDLWKRAVGGLVY